MYDNVHVNIENNHTKIRKKRKFEAHREYNDIQYVITGSELLTIAPVSKLKGLIPYVPEKDIEFYVNSLNVEDYILNAGEFLIIPPWRTHIPCTNINGGTNVRKTVIKIPVSKYFSG